MYNILDTLESPCIYVDDNDKHICSNVTQVHRIAFVDQSIDSNFPLERFRLHYCYYYPHSFVHGRLVEQILFVPTELGSNLRSKRQYVLFLKDFRLYLLDNYIHMNIIYSTMNEKELGHMPISKVFLIFFNTFPFSSKCANCIVQK